MSSKNSSVLSVLALVAAALATAPGDTKALAASNKRSEDFKKALGLENDKDVDEALGAVISAAESAPVTADATHAAKITNDFLAEEDEPEKKPAPAAASKPAPDAIDATARNVNADGKVDEAKAAPAPAKASEPAKQDASKQQAKK